MTPFEEFVSLHYGKSVKGFIYPFECEGSFDTPIDLEDGDNIVISADIGIVLAVERQGRIIYWNTMTPCTESHPFVN